MGSCVSLHKNPDSAMKIRLQLGSRAKGLFAPSPAKKASINGGKPGADSGLENKKLGQQLTSSVSPSRMGSSSRNSGSKEETFFDSQAWLDSDCEDDFLSVNGEFTPSRGSTPNYQRSAPGTPQLNKAFFVEGLPNGNTGPSPTDKRKRLADFFVDSAPTEQDAEYCIINNERIEVSDSHSNSLPKSSNGTPHMSGPISPYGRVVTPNREIKQEKEKKAKGAQCCLPSLVTSLSFSEKKKHLSPPHLNGG